MLHIPVGCRRQYTKWPEGRAGSSHQGPGYQNLEERARCGDQDGDTGHDTTTMGLLQNYTGFARQVGMFFEENPTVKEEAGVEKAGGSKIPL